MPKRKDRRLKSAEKSQFKAQNSATGGAPAAAAAGGTGSVFGGSPANSDDDDASSVVTHLTLDDGDDTISVLGDALESADPDVSEDAWRRTEDKLKEDFDNAGHRNPRPRTAALRSVVKFLTKLYIPEFLAQWKVTLVDTIERALKKPDLESQRLAVQVSSLLSVQLGLEMGETQAEFVKYLRPIACDDSQPIVLRMDCCNAIGVYTMLCEEEAEEMSMNKQALRSVWGSFKTNCAVEAGPLYATSLSMWTLVLLHPKLPTAIVNQALRMDLPKLCSYLDSPHLDFRIATGESIALLYELAWDVNPDFRAPNHFNLLTRFLELAEESVKYRGKKDRRVQRATFRDIHSAIREGTTPDLTVKFGNERLLLDSWWQKLCYDTLCGVLGAGMNLHLKENTLVRDCFQLGAPVLESSIRRLTKSERLSINAQQSKARTLLRTKQRGCKERLGSFSAA